MKLSTLPLILALFVSCQTSEKSIHLQIQSYPPNTIINKKISATVLYKPLILIPWVNSNWESSGHLGWKSFVTEIKNLSYPSKQNSIGNYSEIYIPSRISGAGFYRFSGLAIKEEGKDERSLTLEPLSSTNAKNDRIFLADKDQAYIIKIDSPDWRFPPIYGQDVFRFTADGELKLNPIKTPQEDSLRRLFFSKEFEFVKNLDFSKFAPFLLLQNSNSKLKSLQLFKYKWADSGDKLCQIVVTAETSENHIIEVKWGFIGDNLLFISRIERLRNTTAVSTDYYLFWKNEIYSKPQNSQKNVSIWNGDLTAEDQEFGKVLLKEFGHLKKQAECRK